MLATIFRHLRSPWSAYLLLGALATAGYFALPLAVAQDLVYGIIGLSAVIAILVGVRLHRPARRAPWYLLALGDGLAVVGDLIWTYHEGVLGIATPFPSLADALYLAGSAAFCAGVLVLARGGLREHGAALDTAILAIGGGVVAWVFLIDPIMDDAARPPLERLVASAYPLIDVLILAAIARLTLGRGWRTASARLLTLALLGSLAADLAYAVLTARGAYLTGHPVDAGWLLAYLLHGAAALHPAMREDLAGRADPEAALPRGRLPLLAAAALTGPALLALQTARGAHIDVEVVVAASAALFLLALARLRLLASALREREARFRALVQRAAEGVAIVDARGVARYQSPAVAAIVGYAPEELLGRDIFARVHPDDAATALGLFGALLAEPGGSRECDLRVRHADGAWRVLEVRGTNLLADPAVGGVVLNYRDITERTRVEEERRQGAESFASLFEATDEGLLIHADGRILDANPAYAAMLGRELSAVIGSSGLDYLTPASRALAERRIRDRDERPYEAEVVRLDGTILPVELAGRPIRYHGRPARLVAQRDISARKAAEAALRASERDYRELLEQAADAIFIFGDDGRFVRANARARLLTGYDGEELLALGIADIMPPEERGALAGRIAALDDGPRTRERVVRRKDGARIPAEISATRLPDGRVQVIIRDITARKALEEQLLRQATHDPLTGLPNRALFRDRLGQALARAARRGGPTCAVLLLDLDRFKTINDSLGHAVGDELLVAVAARLRAALRDGDTLARLGGDEFVALLEDIDGLADALRAADRLHAALADPLAFGGRSLFAAASIGVALQADPADGPEELLRFADVAMYRAKEAGRGGTEAFYPGMSAAALERLELEHDLRLALGRAELVVHYQPIVDLATGAVVKLEALVRWRHPTRGLVPPGAFIPLAEETGLIAPLGRWVLAEACRQLVDWRARHPGRAVPALSVNLSPRQFRNPDLVAEVAATLAATGLPPALLQLEVTETAAMAQPDAGIATLEALKALGVGLAIDDFGSGYSSLAYLQRLPVDILKIDRALLRPGERNRAIVRAVTDLAHGLGLGVTAEGLETAAQVAWARAAGCDWGQGYFFGRPVPPEEAAALLVGELVAAAD